MASKKKQTTKKQGRGRPPEYNPKHHIPWVRMLARQGMTGVEIAKEMGITERTLYNWAKKDQDFFQSLNEGRESTDSEVENALLKKALGGVVKETRKTAVRDSNGDATGKQRVEIIEREVLPDTAACIFWLKNRQPDKWRDKREYEHALVDKIEDDALSAELEKLAAEM